MKRYARFTMSPGGLELVALEAGRCAYPRQVNAVAGAVALIWQHTTPGLSPSSTFADAIAAAEFAGDGNLSAAFQLLGARFAETSERELSPLLRGSGLAGFERPRISSLRVKIIDPDMLDATCRRYARGLEVAGDSAAEVFADSAAAIAELRPAPGSSPTAGELAQWKLAAVAVVADVARYLQHFSPDWETFASECERTGGLERY